MGQFISMGSTSVRLTYSL